MRRAHSTWDPLSLNVERALQAGWNLIPQAGPGWCENALVRTHAEVSDLVALPVLGDSTVVRLGGGPRPGYPRESGRELWRHQVPPEVALDWLLAGPGDEASLVRELSRRRPRPPKPTTATQTNGDHP